MARTARIALVVIFAASQLFVGQLEKIGPELGLSSSVTALPLSPVATELPEVMNAIICLLVLLRWGMLTGPRLTWFGLLYGVFAVVLFVVG